jgi:hypothetical protein
VSTYRDQELTCTDCGRRFLWGAREQEFYAEKGYRRPGRCNGCKQAQREEFERKSVRKWRQTRGEGGDEDRGRGRR